MERDFLSLGIAQQIPEDTPDVASGRSSPMQWPFSKKGGSSILSFHGVQEKKQAIGIDFCSSNLSSAMESAEAVDYPHKSIVSESPGGLRYTMTTHHPTTCQDMHSFNRPVNNQRSSTFSPVEKTCNFKSRKNMIGSQLLSVGPLTNPVPAVPCNSSVGGTSDSRNCGAQLTIFYNGSVCVYDNVAPEKAQAIMLLAGNGPPNKTLPPPPVPRPTTTNTADGLGMSQSPNCSSPVPLNSIHVSRPSTSVNGDANMAKSPSAVLISTEAKAAHHSPASVAAATISPGAVPQFRQKSLARFLEKRKERVVICANPYGKKPEHLLL